MILFGTVLLCTKYLADLADLNGNVNQDSKFPHNRDTIAIDPWNVNDHPVSFSNDHAVIKRKRNAKAQTLSNSLLLSNGKKL